MAFLLRYFKDYLKLQLHHEEFSDNSRRKYDLHPKTPEYLLFMSFVCCALFCNLYYIVVLYDHVSLIILIHSVLNNIVISLSS